MPDCDRTLDLVRSYVDGILDDAGREELQHLLDESREARRTFVQEVKLHASLRVHLGGVETWTVDGPARGAGAHGRADASLSRTSRLLRFALPLAAAAGIAVAVGVFWSWIAGRGLWEGKPAAQPDSRRMVARVTEVSGRVSLAAGVMWGGRREPVSVGMEIHEGDRIEVGAASPDEVTSLPGGRRGRTGDDRENGDRVRLAYVGEQTNIELTGWSELVIRPLFLHLARGTLKASVAPRPAHNPMTITTPHAELMVMGTTLSLNVSGEESRLDVLEGVVRVRIPVGNDWHDVGEGQWAVAKAGAEALLAPGRVIRRIPLRREIFGEYPGIVHGIAFTGSSLWLLPGQAWTLYELDVAEERLLRRVKMDEGLAKFSQIAWDGMLVWGIGRDRSTLNGVDPADGRTVKMLPLPEHIRSGRTWGTSDLALDFSHGFLWLGYSREIFKINPSNGRIEERLEIEFPALRRIRSLTCSGDWIYAMTKPCVIHRIRPADGHIISSFRFMELRCVPRQVTRGAGTELWVLDLKNIQLLLLSTDREVPNGPAEAIDRRQTEVP